MATSRDSLHVDTIYYVESDQMYFVTPDGIGGYWYDTFEEAQEEHGVMRARIIPDLED